MFEFERCFQLPCWTKVKDYGCCFYYYQRLLCFALEVTKAHYAKREDCFINLHVLLRFNCSERADASHFSLL